MYNIFFLQKALVKTKMVLLIQLQQLSHINLKWKNSQKKIQTSKMTIYC